MPVWRHQTANAPAMWRNVRPVRRGGRLEVDRDAVFLALLFLHWYETQSEHSHLLRLAFRWDVGVLAVSTLAVRASSMLKTTLPVSDVVGLHCHRPPIVSKMPLTDISRMGGRIIPSSKKGVGSCLERVSSRYTRICRDVCIQARTAITSHGVSLM
jgi:hypothetical protein